MGCEGVGLFAHLLAQQINHHSEIVLFEEVRPVDQVVIKTSFEDRTFLVEAILNDSYEIEFTKNTSQDKLFQFHQLIIRPAGFICRCKGVLSRGPPTTRVYLKPEKLTLSELF